MFDQLKERIKKHLAYNSALKEAVHNEKLKNVKLEAKIRNDLRLKALKQDKKPSLFKNKTKVGAGYKSSAGFDIMNGEF
jgi:hypothetical protein